MNEWKYVLMDGRIDEMLDGITDGLLGLMDGCRIA